MKKFVVEMAVGFCASLTVDAINKEVAIKLAKQLVLEDAMEYYDGNLEIEGVNFVQEVSE